MKQNKFRKYADLTRRGISFLLALILVLSAYGPGAAYATGETEPSTTGPARCRHCNVELTEGAVHSVACPTNCKCAVAPAEGQSHEASCPLNLQSRTVTTPETSGATTVTTTETTGTTGTTETTGTTGSTETTAATTTATTVTTESTTEGTTETTTESTGVTVCEACGYETCICALEGRYLLNGAKIYKNYADAAEEPKVIDKWNKAIKLKGPAFAAEDGTAWYEFTYANVLTELFNGYHFVRVEDTTAAQCTCVNAPAADGTHEEGCGLIPMMATQPKTAYEQAMEDLKAFEEEAKHLADNLDKTAADYIKQLEDACWEFDVRLMARLDEIVESEEMDFDQILELSELGDKIYKDLETLYNYKEGGIETFVGDWTPVTNNTTINATVKLFDYDSDINNRMKTEVFKDANTFFRFKDDHPTSADGTGGDLNTTLLYTSNFSVAPNLTSNGYPMITSNPDENGNTTNYGELDLLFIEKNKSHGGYWLTTMSNGGGLFQYDENTGYYEYDCAKNAVAYDANANKFVLYNNVVRPPYRETPVETDDTWIPTYAAHFLPFNDPAAVQDQLRTEITNQNGKKSYVLPAVEDVNGYKLNLWFGMTVEFDFLMPKDGVVNNQDMVFNFRGDDDVMVYIDDVLVLDISGAHRAMEASINFKTGAVIDPESSAESNMTIKKRFQAAGKTGSVEWDGDTFADYTVHTLKFFYLERGGVDSNCRLKFNMPTLPENSLTVSNEVKNDPKKTKFNFRVELEDTTFNTKPAEVYYSVNGVRQSQPMTLTNGVGTFQLGHGDFYTFELGLGYKYKVTEVDANKNGFTTTFPENQSGILNENNAVTLNYINTLNPSATVTDKTVSEAGELGDYLLTLEGYATGTITTVQSVKPADIVVVFDLSGSMVHPQNTAAKLTKQQMIDDPTHKANAANPLYYYAAGIKTNVFMFYYKNTWMLYDTGTRVSDVPKLNNEGVQVGWETKIDKLGMGGWRNVIHSKEEILAAAERVIQTGKSQDLPKLTASGYSDDNTDPANYSQPKVAKMTSGNWTTFDTNGIWQTRYGAVYDALKTFATDLSKDTETDHKIAIVGFGGPYEPGTALYVNGTAYRKASSDGSGTTLTNTPSLYTQAFMDADTQYTQVMNSINALHVNQTLTYMDQGLEIAKGVYDYNPIDSAKRDRIVIVFSDGQTVDSTNAVEDAEAVKGVGASVYSVATGTADDGVMGNVSSGSGYFLRADTAGELKDAFNTILNKVNGTDVSLNANSVLRDTISGNFKLREGINQENVKSHIKVYTSAYKGNGVFAQKNEEGWEEITNLDSTVITLGKSGDLDVVNVSGFDYSADGNYVITTQAGGKKLVVEIPIEINTEIDIETGKVKNPGDNYQETNVDDESGIYDGTKKVEDFPMPHVDTPATASVSVTVKGNMADINKEFSVTAVGTQYAAVNGKYYDDIPIDSTIDSNYLQAKVCDLEESNFTTGFNLKHGTGRSISNLYIGSEVTFTEIPEGYDVVIYVNGVKKYDEKAPASASYTVTVEPGMTVVFENTKTALIDTGVVLDSLPYIIILAGVAAVAVFLILRRRNRYED